MSEIRDDLWLYDPFGTLQIPGLPISNLDWVLEEGKYGVLKASGPLNEVDSGIFQLDVRFEIHRFLDGDSLGIEGNTQFLLRFWGFGGDRGNETWSIEAYTPEYLLTGRIIDSYASTTTISNALTSKADYADDVIKAFLDEAMGPATPTEAARRIAELTVEPDQSLGPSITKQAAWTPLATVIAEIAADSYANGTWLGFSFEKTGSAGTGLTFRTFTGQRGLDHTQASGSGIIVSQANGNLKNPKVYFDHRSEWTAVRALGKGEGKARLNVRVEDTERSAASPLAYREVKIESSQVDTTAALTALANAELERGRPRRGFSGTLVDTDYARYGMHIRWGDLVTAEYLGYAFSCRLSRVKGTYTKGSAEQLDITLSGEAVE